MKYDQYWEKRKKFICKQLAKTRRIEQRYNYTAPRADIIRIETIAGNLFDARYQCSQMKKYRRLRLYFRIIDCFFMAVMKLKEAGRWKI